MSDSNKRPKDRSSNKPEASKTNNVSRIRREDNSSSNASSNKPGASKNSSASNRSTDPLNEGALPKCEYSSPLGGVIVHITGSPNTATGNNAVVTMATAFRMTVSAATTARIMGSASIASR